MSYKIIPYTLIFVKDNSKILLGLKKRGLGVGKWNGFGGKIEKNESITEGVMRELKEESNLSVDKVNHIGVLVYEVTNRARVDLVHVFTANSYQGVPAESEEMCPQWYDMKDIPYGQMWPDAKLWHSYMLADKYFIARVVYTSEEESFSAADVKEYDSLNTVLAEVDKIKMIFEKTEE